ncbi:hypothetical protein CONLIGDRAFT_642636 [Coniochaeta ligniaria NRRL 30616]|uniref:Mid2 domain-containing protein n=1 Tax=Coniochaeta ligniaria NRRL 30616 TaxID=1408157 RepID=A0A1J7IT96_9PEZI|nr:hypothetical protein CONLIGDRAFT_642636 [Coniochaeta ligniaria NRRL 30616]
MHATQVLNLLVVALSTVGAAQALKIDPQFQTFDIEKRQKTSEPQATGQATNTSPTSSTLPTSSSPLPTSPTSSSITTTPTSSTPQTSDPVTTPPSSSSTPSSTSSPTTHPSSTSSPPVSTTSTTSSQTSVKTSFSTITTVVTTTGSNGQSTTYTSESVSTTTPDLAQASSSGNTGMTPQTRNTVIGVVVGIGGAIVLAGVAFLAIRLYRKKQPDDHDGLMEYNSGFVAADKSEVASSNSQNGRTPFQSTLESYHAPTQVNTASNF